MLNLQCALRQCCISYSRVSSRFMKSCNKYNYNLQKCYMPYSRLSRFMSTNNDNLEYKYESLTGMKFAGYLDWFTEDIATVNSKIMKEKIKAEILPNISKLNNYLEVGAGRAQLITELSPYFNNITLIEPNPLFIDIALQKKKDSAKDYNIIQSMIDEIDFNDDYFKNNKFDLITMQHILWHVPLNEWDNIMYNLCFKCLNNTINSNSTLIVTLFTETGPQYDIHKYFVPETRMISYCLNYYKNILNPNEYNIELYANSDNVILPESMTLKAFVEVIKVDFQIYDKNIYHQRYDEIVDITKKYLKKHGHYTGKIDEQTGEELVKFEWEQGHIIITKL